MTNNRECSIFKNINKMNYEVKIMAIFQIKVSYISRRQKSKTTKGKTGKNLSYISRGTSGAGRAKKVLSI